MFKNAKSASGGNPLWTRDFTIITVGSMVSMFGNSLSGFAMSLMVLDYSNSTFLYAIYIALYTVPQIIMPVISGAVLDRFSRKKTIYMLDFLSAGLYALIAAILFTGWFSFPVFAVYCFVLGMIESIYMVAYESFYPLLITEGNFSRAYAIAGVLETLTAVMVPVSTWLYGQIGLAPLLTANAVCFLIAAILETQIKADEKYIEQQREQAEKEDLEAGQKTRYGRRMLRDIREGFRYLLTEKGLLLIAVYFTFSSLAGGASSVLTLPYFNQAFKNGRYIYILVWGMSFIGRALGGLFHYRAKLPAKKKYRIAFLVYLFISAAEAFYLFTPIAAMMVLCFLTGLGGITSYTIRIAATQSYVPDEKKGRFNGAFNVLNTVGALAGELIAGALTVILPTRGVLAGIMLACVIAAVVFIGGGRRYVAPIYNREE